MRLDAQRDDDDGGGAFGIPLAVGLGLLMGAVVFCMERVLVVSIRQDAPLGHKLAAFAWRGVIASVAAALVTTPFALVQRVAALIRGPS